MAFSEQEFCVRLVKAIEKQECLYNYNLVDYSRKDITENMWIEVAKEVNWEVGKCKEKWRNIRSVFLRHLKGLPSGSKKKRTYYLNNDLQFLIPFIKSVAATADNSYYYVSTSQSETQNTETSDMDTFKCEGDSNNPLDIEYPPIKRERQDISEPDESFIKLDNSYKHDMEDDPNKLFLLSLLPDLHLMNMQQTRKFKRGVLALIDDILD